jgi:CheY-like chemotaxis protein
MNLVANLAIGLRGEKMHTSSAAECLDGHRQSKRSEPKSATSRHRGILVVDDNDQLRTVLELQLKEEGFNTWSAASGLHAIEIYRRHRDEIGFVLLDVRMPGLDGPQTFAALREIDSSMRCCFMSGSVDERQAAELLRLGAACVVHKPFVVDQLTPMFAAQSGLTSAAG